MEKETLHVLTLHEPSKSKTEHSNGKLTIINNFNR